MADAQNASNVVLTALRTIVGVSGVHDGFVPLKVPESGGFIDPYIVLWGGGGDGPPELTADGKESLDTLIWDFQTTAVGATPDICRAVDQATRSKLVNLAVGTGRVRRNPDGFNQQSPILDTQSTPSRFMLPRQWRLITN
jgi:hypothetical protein